MKTVTVGLCMCVLLMMVTAGNTLPNDAPPIPCPVTYPPGRPDEPNCPRGESKCFSIEYNGAFHYQCINKSKFCDNITDCDFEGFDESAYYCDDRHVKSCPEDLLWCNSSCKNLAEWKRCDGIPNCKDGEDENSKLCPKKCSHGKIQCKNGTCIDGKICDGNVDCGANDDEKYCPFNITVNHATLNLTVGDTAILVCSVTGITGVLVNPPPLRWQRGIWKQRRVGDPRGPTYPCPVIAILPDRATEKDGVLTIKSVNVSDSGIYQCLATYYGLSTNTKMPITTLTVTTPAPVPCRSDDFHCDNATCIDKAKRCDRIEDCANKEDEQDCPGPKNCSHGMIKCRNGTCIDGKRCDDKVDCGANDDEKDCPTPAPDVCRVEEFRCHNATCIDKSKRCDHIEDCANKEDEQDCPGFSITSFHWIYILVVIGILVLAVLCCVGCFCFRRERGPEHERLKSRPT